MGYSLAIFNRSENVAVSLLLFISAVMDGDRTVLASFKILGHIPSRPVAFAGFSPFINSAT